MRFIPCLLLGDLGLVKTVKFHDPKYLGDPINAVKIFNDKEVDELIFLDITATVQQASPPFDLLEEIASECFMPLCYGGGVHSLEHMKRLYNLGIEKIAINTEAIENPPFVEKAAVQFGSQSVVVSMDVKTTLFGRYEIRTRCGRKSTGLDPVKMAIEMERRGAGELLLNSIDRDGTMLGLDLELIKQVSKSVGIPVVACGGARDLGDMEAAVEVGGASAAAAGSLFVFHGPHRAVLINYPSRR
jgi:cyclase